MKIEKYPEEACLTCGHVKKYNNEEAWFCDHCQKEIGAERLSLTIFHESEDIDAENIDLCSWTCVANYLKALDRKNFDYFATLPYLNIDNKEGRNLDDFLALLK